MRAVDIDVEDGIIEHDALVDFFLLDRCGYETQCGEPLGLFGPHGGLDVFLKTVLDGQLVFALGQHHAANALIVALHCSCFFPLALGRGLFIELACAQFCQQADLFDRALKAAKGGLKGLIFFNSNNRHRERPSNRQ